MKKVLISSIVIIFLSGCTNQQALNQSLAPARQVIIKPAVIHIPNKTNYHLIYGNDAALENAFNHFARTGRAPNIITDGFVKFAYNSSQQPIVKTTPFQETVISLEPGEKFTNVTSGDPSRWMYAAAVSGSGITQQQNILVKPSYPDISTNLIITTDKRIYNLKLISSSDARSVKSVSFWYPEEMVEAVNNATFKQTIDSTVSSSPDINLNSINFNYTISSDGFFRSLPSWRPVRVFDDGTHTYMQFPPDISSRDMPVLFILNGSNKELVNYRYKKPYFVVDKIFNRAVLVMGVGRDESKVIITNNLY